MIKIYQKLLISFSVILIATTSCNTDSYEDCVFHNSMLISESTSRIETTISRFSTEIGEQTPRITSINKLFPSTKSTNNIPVYEVITEGEDGTPGFAIVGDEELSGIVFAYVPSGSLSDTTFNVGLESFMDGLSSTLSDWADTSFSHPGPIVNPFDSYEGFFIVPNSAQFVATMPMDSLSKYNVSPPLEVPNSQQETTRMFPTGTKWDQGSPYNSRVPYYRTDVPDERVVVGCTPIAVGQIFAHHRYPNVINWNYITINDTIQEGALGNLVGTLLYDRIATVLLTEYNCDENLGSTYVSNIHRVFDEYDFEYLTATPNSTVNNSSYFFDLFGMYPYPMLMNAQRLARENGEAVYHGHSWVIEGAKSYSFWRYKAFPGEQEFTLIKYQLVNYLTYNNWGWGGTSDGWYIYFAPDYNRYYKFDYYLFYNIHHNN